jgi:hypothetical protein
MDRLILVILAIVAWTTVASAQIYFGGEPEREHREWRHHHEWSPWRHHEDRDRWRHHHRHHWDEDEE